MRAAAVTALAKFGVGQKDPEVKRSVTVLLTRCLDDIDDEVRDRAALNLRLIASEDELANRFIKNGRFALAPLHHDNNLSQIQCSPYPHSSISSSCM